jgi:hypothetical protein
MARVRRSAGWSGLSARRLRRALRRSRPGRPAGSRDRPPGGHRSRKLERAVTRRGQDRLHPGADPRPADDPLLVQRPLAREKAAPGRRAGATWRSASGNSARGNSPAGTSPEGEPADQLVAGHSGDVPVHLLDLVPAGLGLIEPVLDGAEVAVEQIGPLPLP